MDFIAPDAQSTAGEAEGRQPGVYTPQSAAENAAGNISATLAGEFGQGSFLHKVAVEQTGTYYGPGGLVTFNPEPNNDAKDNQARFPGVKGLDQPMPLSVAQGVADMQQRREAQADAAARYPSGVGNAVLAGAANMVAGFLDPVQDAAFMVPVVGEARYAAWLASAGEAGGIFGRAAVTAGVGAARGVAGGAATGIAEKAIGVDPDMALGDIASQAVQTGMMGGVFHSAFSFKGDILGRRFIDSDEGRAAVADARVDAAATRTAAAQIASGRAVDTVPVFDAARSHKQFQSDLKSGTAPPLEGYGTPESRTRLDDAVSAASGAPTQDDLQRAALVQEAKTADLSESEKGAAAEAERSIAALRQAGRLTPEDEAEIAQFAPAEEAQPRETKVPNEQEKNVQPVSEAATPEAAILRGAPRAGEQGIPGEGEAEGGIARVAGEEPEAGRGGPEEGEQPAAEVPVKGPISHREISEDTAITAAGRSVPVKYALAEAGDLVPSQTQEGNPNPAYPKELQPRDRSRAVSNAQIADISQNLNPALLDKMPMASHGAPIISPDGTVESGNGRTLAVQRAYSQGGAEAYRAHVAEQGYPVEGMKEPVLVRVRQGEMTPEERQAFAREANQGGTLAMSATERASADAASMPDHLLDLYRGGDVESAANRPFVRAFMDAAVDKTEQGAMVGPDGSLSQDAIRRVQGALLSKAYGDANVVSAIIESPDAGIRAIGGALTDAAADWAKMRAAARDGDMPAAMDQTPRLLDAVKIVRHARAEGRNVAEYVGQADMFTGKSIDPETEAYLRLMFRDTVNWTQPVGREKLGEALRFYAEEARIISSEGDLLGETHVTAADILARAKGRMYGRETERPNLFAGPAPRHVESVREAGAAGTGPGVGGAEGGRIGEAGSGGEQPAAVYAAGRSGPTGVSRAQVLSAPTFFSALTRGVENLKLEKAPAEQWLNTIRNLGGVKRDEIDWSGVEPWLREQKGTVTRAAVLEHLRENEVNVQEVEKTERAVSMKTLDEVSESHFGRPYNELDVDDRSVINEAANDIGGETKFSSYKLPGGENYRELLLTLPPKDQVTRVPSKSPEGWGTTEGGTEGFEERGNRGQDFRSGHFDEPNVLAHVRFDDRTGPNGEKVLHVAEIQSDWHQKGRKIGYQGEYNGRPLKEIDADLDKLGAEIDARANTPEKPPSEGWGKFHQAWKDNPDLSARHDALMAERRPAQASTVGVPNAPFKTSWPELAMKRMIRYAAENGYDRLSWDTGETSAERYDLSKKISRVEYTKSGDSGFTRPEHIESMNEGRGTLTAFDHSGKKVIDKYISDEKELPELVGKDVADKLIAAKPRGNVHSGTAQLVRSLEGLDLKVGGEGMRAFYDKQLPIIANKIGKKFGAKTESDFLPGLPADKLEKRYEVYESSPGVWRISDSETGGDLGGNFHGPSYAETRIRDQINEQTRGAPVHSIHITDAMKKSVMEGQPLFQRQPFGKRGVTESPRATRPMQFDDGTTLHLPDDPSPAETKIINDVKDIANRIVPDAKVYAARRIDVGEGFRQEAGIEKSDGAGGLTQIDSVRNLIAWSLESPDARVTIRHEAVHWLRANGYIKDDEWSAIEAASRSNDWRGQFNIEQRYPNAPEWLKTEESAAEAMGYAKTAPDWVPDALKPIFEKVNQLLSQIADHVRRIFGANVTAKDVFSRIESGEVGQRIPGMTDERAAAQAQQTPRTPEDEANRARARITAMQDVVKRQAIMDYIEHARTNGLGLAHGITAKMRGISESIEGARDSTETDMTANREKYLGTLITGLEKIPGAQVAWDKRLMTADWTRELFELSRTDGKGKPGVTGNKMALDIAKAVHDSQTLAKFEGNRAGAWRGDYNGYIARTQHNAEAIHQAGYQAWRDFTLVHLDQGRTFEGLNAQEIEDFMTGSWHALSTGIHLTSSGGVPGLGGTGNLASRLSQSRVFHWKDADSWRAYQTRFGQPDIELGVAQSLMRAGRDVALMKRWGSNPQYSFEKIVRDVREKYREDHGAISALAKQEPRLREEFKHLTGDASIPKEDLAYKIISAGRAIEDISKLNQVVFAHLSVMATKPYQMRFLGMGRFQAYTAAIRNLVEDKSPQGRALMENLHSNATGRIQSMMHGYEPFADVPGAIARTQAFTLRLGGLPWLLSHEKAGTTWETANLFGQNVGKTFDELNPKMQRILSLHAISPAEWDVLRNAPDHDKDATGISYLTPKAADRASPQSIDSLALSRIATAAGPEDVARIQKDVRDNLAMKLAGLYADTAGRSVVTPGIAERALFTRTAGAYAGPLVGQYKTWAAAAVRQMWGQAIHGMGRAEAAKALAGLFAMMTVMGAARSSIGDVIKGETPDMPNADMGHDAALFAKWVVAGGGMGIFGDYVIGTLLHAGASSKDRTLSGVGALAGPVVEDAAQLLFGIGGGIAEAPFAKNAQERDKELAKQGDAALNFLISHLPVVNTFYIRKVMDWLVLDRLHEMTNPGYMKRYQAAVKAKTGQDSFLPPNFYLGAPQQGTQQ